MPRHTKPSLSGLSDAQRTDLFDSVPLGYFFLDGRGNIRHVNRSGAVMLGVVRTALLHQPFGAFVLQTSQTQFNVLLCGVHDTQAQQSCELELRPAVGAPIWVLAEVVPDSDEPDLYRMTVVDITHHKQTEISLRQRLAELEAVHRVSSALRTILTVEEALPLVLDTTLAALNTDTGAIRLYDPETDQLHSAVGRGWFMKVDRGPMRSDEGIGGRVFTSKQTHVSQDFRRDANVRASAVSVIPEGWGGICVPILTGQTAIGVLFVAVNKPSSISREQVGLLESLAELVGATLRRIRLYEQTQTQAKRTQQIIDSAPEGMLVLDQAGRLVQVNPLARRYLGDLSIGETVDFLGGRPVGELLRGEASKSRWHELTWGQPARIFEVASQCLGTVDHPDGWLLLLRDVTEARESQRYQQNQENLAAVGQLAAGIAHDFNNVLGAISLYVDLLERGGGLVPKQQKQLAAIAGQSRYAANLVQQILDFGRRTILSRTPMDLLPVLNQLVASMQRTVPDGVHLRVIADSDAYPIMADATRIAQMLRNLAANGVDAMPQGGMLTFTLRTLTLAPQTPMPLPDLSPGPWLRLDVMDTGTGIAPHDLPHVFQPFFTTKEVGKGVGLGLSQVYGIVKQHDGVIGVESQWGQGTIFSIYLPRFQPEGR